MKYPRLKFKEECPPNAIDSNRLLPSQHEGFKKLGAVLKRNEDLIQLRAGGMLIGRAFFLDGNYDWVIGKDDQDCLCLVPMEKEK